MTPNRIELDDASLTEGFNDGKAGNNDPYGVIDRLAYASGHVEGSAVDEDGPEPSEEGGPK